MIRISCEGSGHRWACVIVTGAVQRDAFGSLDSFNRAGKGGGVRRVSGVEYSSERPGVRPDIQRAFGQARGIQIHYGIAARNTGGIVRIRSQKNFLAILEHVSVRVRLVWIGACIAGAHKNAGMSLNCIVQAVTVRVRLQRISSGICGADPDARVRFHSVLQPITVCVGVARIGAFRKFLQVGKTVIIRIFRRVSWVTAIECAGIEILIPIR